MRALEVATLVLTPGLVLSFLSACSAGPDAAGHGQRTTASAPASAATPRPATVFDPVTRAPLERARGVQGTIDASAERTRAALEREERGDSAP